MHRALTLAIALALAEAIGSASAGAASAISNQIIESEQARFRIVTIADGLEHPWGLAFTPNGDMLVTERAGRLRRIRAGRLESTPISGVPRDILIERLSGLHDIALHPQFESTNWVYLSYTAGTHDANRLTLRRYRLQDDALVDDTLLFQTHVAKVGPGLTGGGLAFLPDGTLLLSVGDGTYLYKEDDPRFRPHKQAQNLGNALGSIVRLHDDGSIPPNNPFIDHPTARPEIYAYGLRNAQGVAYRPGAHQVWAVEHGARGGDELNLITAGSNYGWPAITYGVNYDGAPISEHRRAAQMRQPAWYWVPSIGPSSLTFCSSSAFPEWRGDLFVGALKGARLLRLELEGDAVIGVEPLLVDLQERIRNVRCGPDGFVYVLTDHPAGRVLRLEPIDP